MNKNVMVSIRMIDDMKEQLEQIAAMKDISLSQLVREIIKGYLEGK